MGTPKTTAVGCTLIVGGMIALAACSGGTSSLSPAGATQAQSVDRGRAPAVPNPYPTTVGQQSTYAYSLTLSNSPGTTRVTTGSITTTLVGSTTFNGNPVLDNQSVFTYSVPQPPGTLTGTTTTDDYVNFTTANYFDYGHNISGSETAPTFTDTSSNTQTYTGSPFILDIFPEKNSNKATEPGAYSLTASFNSIQTSNGYVSNTSETYNRNNDGSSTTSETITLGGNPYTYSNTINNDYSASETNGLPGQSNTGSTTFSAPNAGSVTVVYTPLVGSPTTNTPPVWWGSTPLLSDQFKQIAAAIGVPARCHSSYTGTHSVELAETLSYVDPVNGYTDAETINRFIISGVGVACLTNTRLITYYDNRKTGNQIGTTSISVTQGLTSYTPAKGHERQVVGFGVTGGVGVSGGIQYPIGLKLEKFLHN
jgi:hypothetical protein